MTKCLRYLVFDPICLRSDLCSNVENGGGFDCPSKLPLKQRVSNKVQEAFQQERTFSHWPERLEHSSLQMSTLP